MARLRSLLITAATLAAALPATASAFDTEPHSTITIDAMRAEGFGALAADVGAIDNYLVDLYSQGSTVPFSGSADTLNYLLGGALFQAESWPKATTDAAALSHFDFSVLRPGNPLNSSADLEREWDRLRRATRAAALAAKGRNDPLELLTVIGASLHPLQDFYTHTNWVEPQNRTGFDGPGWEAAGQGRTPTWFDVPKPVRDLRRLYSSGGPGQRPHGPWRADQNVSLATAINKDWPGRPLHTEARIAAYFATRQWIRSIQTWVSDPVFWRRAQAYATRPADIAYDRNGAYAVSAYSGHWQGGGGPCKPGCGIESGDAGNLLSLRAATKAYFENRGPTPIRRTFERVLPALAADPATPIEQVPVAPVTPLQRTTQFVRAQILRQGGIDLGDPGPVEADLFTEAVVAGQPFLSTVIHGHDTFAFPRPHHPTTWFKALPVGLTFGAPVTSIEVEVHTGDVRFAGTNDDVTLRLGPGLSFPLDKRVYDDFERDDRDTYSVPIDAATRAGLDVTDIRYVEIAKSADGPGGGWRLGGIRLSVNGREVLRRDGIDRWLEERSRVYRVPGFTPARTRGTAVPVWLRLGEDDRVLGDDDRGDINEADRRDAVALAYTPGTLLTRTVTGGSRLAGRLSYGGDRSRLTYRLDTIRPVVPAGP